jgi:O-antigen/teichoic acid export membrane protein
MLLAWPTYIACAVLAPDLLRAFGKNYDTAAPVVVMLCIAMLAATASGAVDAVLLMSGHSWMSLGNNLFALALNIGLNVLLIPKYGAVGAGISWTAAIVLRNLLPMIQIAWKYHISPIGRETALVALASLLTVGAVPLVLRLVSAPTLWVLAALVVGMAVFLLVVWRLREDLQLNAFVRIVKQPRRRVRQA